MAKRVKRIEFCYLYYDFKTLNDSRVTCNVVESARDQHNLEI